MIFYCFYYDFAYIGQATTTKQQQQPRPPNEDDLLTLAEYTKPMEANEWSLSALNMILRYMSNNNNKNISNNKTNKTPIEGGF